ncbi:MAG: DUF1501 domain-containing protein [Planctomycetaceae bacterium]
MTTGYANKFKRCDGMSRRAVLQLGQLAGLGIGLSRWNAVSAAAVGDARVSSSTVASKTSALPSETAQIPRPLARSCILIWLDGGPSHLETFDLKPEAAKEVRGPLSAISTRISGVAISECLPELALRMDEIAIIRSMTSPLGEHNLGTHYLLTGYKPTPVLQYPPFHAVASFKRQTDGMPLLPPSIAIPDHRVGGGRFTGSGFLPQEFGPFSIGADPSRPDFRVKDLESPAGLSLDRIDRRRMFAEQLARWDENQGRSNSSSQDSALNRAVAMVTSAKARAAFDLEEETPATRRRYGMKTIGQSCLLARRLIERGVPFVTVNDRGWDTHDNLYTRLKEGYTGAKTGVGLIPSLDLAVSSLIDDLRDRALLDETLIVVMGEFGRTPKINTSGGRDHWPRVFSVMLAGGGVRGGQVIGSSDSTGESPSERPVTPSDLICTIYNMLGFNPSDELRTDTGRPVRLAGDEAKVVRELLS